MNAKSTIRVIQRGVETATERRIRPRGSRECLAVLWICCDGTLGVLERQLVARLDVRNSARDDTPTDAFGQSRKCIAVRRVKGNGCLQDASRLSKAGLALLVD